jgi:hypothetical protein
MPDRTQQSHLAQCKSLNALQLAIYFVGHVQCAEKILERDGHTCEGGHAGAGH